MEAPIIQANQPWTWHHRRSATWVFCKGEALTCRNRALLAMLSDPSRDFERTERYLDFPPILCPARILLGTSLSRFFLILTFTKSEAVTKATKNWVSTHIWSETNCLLTCVHQLQETEWGRWTSCFALKSHQVWAFTLQSQFLQCHFSMVRIYTYKETHLRKDFDQLQRWHITVIEFHEPLLQRMLRLQAMKQLQNRKNRPGQRAGSWR